jgi:hypothetical protein
MNVRVCTQNAAQFVIDDAHFVRVERCPEMERSIACGIGAPVQCGLIREGPDARFRKRTCGIAGGGWIGALAHAAREYR